MSHLYDRLRRAKRLKARHTHRDRHHPERDRRATRESLAGREIAAAVQLAHAAM